MDCWWNEWWIIRYSWQLTYWNKLPLRASSSSDAYATSVHYQCMNRMIDWKFICSIPYPTILTYLHWEKGFHVWKNTPCLHSKLRWLQAHQKKLVSFNRQLLTETCGVSYPLPDIYFAAHAARAADAHDLCFTRSCLFRRAIAQAGENLTRRVW